MIIFDYFSFLKYNNSSRSLWDKMSSSKCVDIGYKVYWIDQKATVSLFLENSTGHGWRLSILSLHLYLPCFEWCTTIPIFLSNISKFYDIFHIGVKPVSKYCVSFRTKINTFPYFMYLWKFENLKYKAYFCK